MPTGELYVCGGGAYNSIYWNGLRWRLRKHNWSVQTTDVLGLAPTWVEQPLCMVGDAFRSNNSVAILPTVTGASGDHYRGNHHRCLNLKQ